ncbi:MAG: type IV secretion protein Rhs [Cyanobacteria bacterium SBLK]|nr:type IV secretion protein Rhs [Cyanobacteria bacterium SBLK]
MEIPAAQDTKLESLIRKLYRPGARVGSGSTAAAIRKERETGQPVGGRLHEQKGKDFIKALQKWLDKNLDASPQDRRTAENLILDLQDALKH